MLVVEMSEISLESPQETKQNINNIKDITAVDETKKIINNVKSNIKMRKDPVAKGETILSSVPFAYILKGSLKGVHCDNCFRKKQTLQRCSGCACSYYCNTECQKTSWIIHKNECKKLKKMKKYPPDTVRLIARVIFKLKNGGNDIKERVTNQRWRRFKDLMNHYKDIKDDPSKQEHFQSTLLLLTCYLGEENLMSEEELLEIFGRVYVNCFTITDKDLNGVGLGLYLAASIFDHSCKPNVYASFNGIDIVMKALYDFPDLDFSQLRISYIDVLNTKENRIKELEEGYFFTCDCSLCLDKSRDLVSFSIICGNASCSQPVYIGERDEIFIKPCTKCGFKDFNSGTKEKYFQIVSVIKKNIEGLKSNSYLELSKNLIEHQVSFLHKLNLWKVRLLDAAFESAIYLTLWDDAIRYGKQNLDGLKFYYGSNHAMYGLGLLKLAKIESLQFRMEEAINHLCLAEPILHTCLGKENPICVEELKPLLKQVRQEITMMQNSGFNVYKNKS